MNQYAKADIIFSKFCKAYMELNSMLPISSSEMEVLSFVAKRKGQYISAVIANIHFKGASCKNYFGFGREGICL